MIYVVGIGPGGEREMTCRAIQALEASDIIIGYKTYVDLLAERFGHKELYASPMKGEVERCRRVLDLASSGKNVALVSSGDAGVYGMAGLMLEVAAARPEARETTIEIVPGVTAACSAAAVLGAPLMHDFATISLSDLLTPWAVIEKRLAAAAAADFVLCLYNPASRSRYDHLQKACDIVMRERRADTPSGWVRNAGRAGQTSRVLTLAELRNETLDMFCTVFIGNGMTEVVGGRMVTPRGYPLEGRADGE